MPPARPPSTRLYADAPLTGSRLALDADQAHYLGRVLRCRDGDRLVVFNGRGSERLATVTRLARREAALALGTVLTPIPEPRRRVTLLQALVKSDAMDLIVQKATELGAAAVLAFKSDYSVVRLDSERRERRIAHWRRIATSACEQSGRHRPPDIEVCDDLDAALARLPADSERVAFTPGAGAPFAPAALRAAEVCAAIGPEGGFTPDEAGRLAAAGFALQSLGPRTLRADTAAITVCAGLALQADEAKAPEKPAD